MSHVPRMRLRFDRETGEMVESRPEVEDAEFNISIQPDARFHVHSVEAWCPGFEHYDTDGTPVVTNRTQIENALRANPGASYGDIGRS